MAVRGLRPVALPEDTWRPAGPSMERVAAVPSASVIEGLQARAEEQGVGQQSLLLAAWHGLLGRLSGRSNVVVDVLSGGRKFDELAEAVGVFAEYLPVVGPGPEHSLASAAECSTKPSPRPPTTRSTSATTTATTPGGSRRGSDSSSSSGRPPPSSAPGRPPSST